MMVESMAEFQERFARHFKHVRWIVETVMALIEVRYHGSLIIDFDKGYPSRKIEKQIIEYVE